MKLKIRLTANKTTDFESLTLDDLDLTVEQWESMSDEEKNDAVQNYVHDLPEQPYWVVDKILEQ